jgi:hypothetical protein
MEWHICLTKHILKQFLTKMGHDLLHILVLLFISTSSPSITIFSQAGIFWTLTQVSSYFSHWYWEMETDCPRFDVKVKEVPMLYQVQHHKGTGEWILTQDGGEWSASNLSTLAPGKMTWYQSDKRLGETQNQFGCCGEEKRPCWDSYSNSSVV